MRLVVEPIFPRTRYFTGVKIVVRQGRLARAYLAQQISVAIQRRVEVRVRDRVAVNCEDVGDGRGAGLMWRVGGGREGVRAGDRGRSTAPVGHFLRERHPIRCASPICLDTRSLRAWGHSVATKGR